MHRNALCNNITNAKSLSYKRLLLSVMYIVAYTNCLIPLATCHCQYQNVIAHFVQYNGAHYNQRQSKDIAKQTKQTISFVNIWFEKVNKLLQYKHDLWTDNVGLCVTALTLSMSNVCVCVCVCVFYKVNATNIRCANRINTALAIALSVHAVHDNQSQCDTGRCKRRKKKDDRY